VIKELRTRRIVNIETGQRMPQRPYLYWVWEILFLGIWSKTSFREYELPTFENGPPIEIQWWFGEPEVTVSTPESIAQILLHKDTDRIELSIVPGSHIEKVIGGSLVTSTDAKTGRKLRRLMDPAFKHKQLGSLIPTFMECTSELLSIWEKKLAASKNNIIDVSKSMKSLTYEIIGRTAFSHKFNCLEGASVEKEMLELYFQGLVQPWEFILGPKLNARLPTAYQKKIESSKQSL